AVAKLPGVWVAERAKPPAATPQPVENRHATLEEGSAERGRLDPLRAAVEQPHAKSIFKLRDGLGDHWMRNTHEFRSLGHGAGLRDREQDMNVAQLYAPADAIGPLHPRGP